MALNGLFLMGALLVNAAAPAGSQKTVVNDDDGVFGAIGTGLGRLEPLGLFLELRGHTGTTLYDHTSSLLADNGIEIGPVVFLSPALWSLGAQVTVRPVAFLDFRVSYGIEHYYGNFGLLGGYSDPDQDYSDAARAARADLPDSDPARPRSATGSRLALRPRLRLKLAQVIVVNTLTYTRTDFDIAPPLYYDTFFDTLVYRRSWTVQNDARLLWDANPLRVGIHHGVQAPQHQRWDHLVGLLATYDFDASTTPWLGDITLIGAVDWWVGHPWRTGLLPRVIIAAQVALGRKAL